MSKKEESIWKKLSNIDCNKFTKSKGQLTYLSWPYAWKIVMENYPKATYKFKEWDGYDVLYYKNGTGWQTTTSGARQATGGIQFGWGNYDMYHVEVFKHVEFWTNG